MAGIHERKIRKFFHTQQRFMDSSSSYCEVSERRTMADGQQVTLGIVQIFVHVPRLRFFTTMLRVASGCQDVES